MEKIALRCDLCGGSLEMQPGGQTAKCEFCGTKYSIGRLREKIQEIRGTVSVEGVVKTTSADFDIQAGVLLHYRGKDTEVVVPEGVHEIGESCFKGMQYLTSITLPEGLVRISHDAFDGCSGLTQINIPQGVKKIGARAFSGCSGLKQITIPDSITEISKDTFKDCTGLTHITLPKGLEKIGEKSFFGCSGLEQIPIPDSVSEIGVWALYNCSELTQVSLPNRLQVIGVHAFWHCSKIASVTGVTEDFFYNNISVKDSEGDTHIPIQPPWFTEIFSDCPMLRLLLRPIYRKQGKCQYCGSYFEGLFTKRCKKCHRIKDY